MNNQNIVNKIFLLTRQKFTWFAFVMVALTVTAFRTRPDEASANVSLANKVVANSGAIETNKAETIVLTTAEPLAARAAQPLETKEVRQPDIIKFTGKSGQKADLVTYALSLQGTPYRFGGKNLKGFDCSGFVYHVFQEYGYNIERSSRTQSVQGFEVNTDEVKPGDLLFFTGTKPEIRTVGHVGIVISEPGEPVQFVHSSSNGGVKVSELEGYYTTRFMVAKRM